MKKEKLKYIVITVFVVLCGIIYSFTFREKEDKTAIIEDSAGTKTESLAVTEEEASEVQQFCVYICGCVVNPGVYHVEPDTRIYTLIELAGGFTQEASKEYLNLADFVFDGQKIIVPTIQEAENGSTGGALVSETSVQDRLVNINTAAQELLMTLPGIGQIKAADIITYRETNGNYKTIEDIMNVAGIKQSVFDKIKNLIKV